MGKVIIESETTVKPISLIGKAAGICYGSDISDESKNFKRGLHNISSGHGRTMEYPQIYVTLSGYSARVIRELYTHIGGAPTRLQASTRYIDYCKGGFDFITPPAIEKDPFAKIKWNSLMEHISKELGALSAYGIDKEDLANGLPLGMTTTIVLRTNLRNLIDMSHQRLCARAYWEFRQLMKDLIKALTEYSEEWDYLITKLKCFKPKCEVCGFCEEKDSCGKCPSKEEYWQVVQDFIKLGKESNN